LFFRQEKIKVAGSQTPFFILTFAIRSLRLFALGRIKIQTTQK